MYDESIDCCREAIRLRANFPEAYNNLGTALHGSERYDEAIDCYRAAIHLRPTFAYAYLNLGNAYKSAKQYDQAVAALRQALEISPHFPLAWLSLGMVLIALESDEAVGCFHRAVQQQPNLAEAHRQLGLAAQAGGRVDEALANYRKAIGADPNLASAHYNLALLSLLTGDFATGWREYEWRWRVPGFPSPMRKYSQPKWDGSNLAGKTLFIHAEQGVGDTLQFARFLPLICQRAAKVIFEVQPPLLRLMQANPLGATEVIGRFDINAMPEGFDLQLPLLSAPAALGMLEPFLDVNHYPYLQADDALRNHWRQLLKDVVGFKVGLAWAGSKDHGDDRFRSIALKKLGPLVQKDVRFISLQVGPASVEAKDPDIGIPLLDWTDNIKDFADTAAIIAELDLVICVDTAVAHLAGALGKPVWLLVPFMPDFRWQLNRDDTPWYPLMKLFRQSKRSDWTDVVGTIAKALEDRVR
jgi:predicted negative regulator of RcsB-dependent stress response